MSSVGMMNFVEDFSLVKITIEDTSHSLTFFFDTVIDERTVCCNAGGTEIKKCFVMISRDCSLCVVDRLMIIPEIGLETKRVMTVYLWSVKNRLQRILFSGDDGGGLLINSRLRLLGSPIPGSAWYYDQQMGLDMKGMILCLRLHIRLCRIPDLNFCSWDHDLSLAHVIFREKGNCVILNIWINSCAN